jgi:hypothetical protein
MTVVVVLLIACERADMSVSTYTSYTARETEVFPDIKCLPLYITLLSHALSISKLYLYWQRTMTVARQSEG